MSQILTVGSESLVASFATRNNYACTPECDRCVALDEGAPNMPFKFDLGFLQNFCFIHDSQDRALSIRSSTLASNGPPLSEHVNRRTSQSDCLGIRRYVSRSGNADPLRAGFSDRLDSGCWRCRSPASLP